MNKYEHNSEQHTHYETDESGRKRNGFYERTQVRNNRKQKKEQNAGNNEDARTQDTIMQRQECDEQQTTYDYH